MDSARPAPRYVLPETVLLALVGGFDLLTTVYLVATGKAHEANPFMANVLRQVGPGGFAAVKALFLAGPLAIAEIARRYNPRFVRNALRCALVAYVVLLGFAYIRKPAQLPPPPEPVADTMESPSAGP